MKDFKLVSPDIKVGEKFISFMLDQDDNIYWDFYTCKSNIGRQQFGHFITCEEIKVSHCFDIETCYETNSSLLNISNG